MGLRSRSDLDGFYKLTVLGTATHNTEIAAQPLGETFFIPTGGAVIVLRGFGATLSLATFTG